MGMGQALKSFRDWLETGLDLAFPWPQSKESEPKAIEEPFCQRCGLPFPALAGQAAFVCNHCAAQTWSFEWARSGYQMAGQVREAVIGFKYGEQFYRREELVQWLRASFHRNACGGQPWDGLVPVPLYHLRLRERGFNQAQELAKGLERHERTPVLNCLYRCRETNYQSKLGRRARLENLRGAFRLKPGFDVRSLNLLVIDDVFTTGATAQACAQILRSGGASRIGILTVARSI